MENYLWDVNMPFSFLRPLLRSELLDSVLPHRRRPIAVLFPGIRKDSSTQFGGYPCSEGISKNSEANSRFSQLGTSSIVLYMPALLL